MIKYKLLKDLPDIDKWTIILVSDDWEYYFEDWETKYHNEFYWIFYRLFFRSRYDDWIEEIS